MSVWSIYPTHHLHIDILGPVNNVFEQIESKVDISSFKKKYCIKGKGPGGEMQGKTIKNIINSEAKLLELEQIITKNDRYMVLFIEHLRNLSRLNSVANSKILDIDNAKKVLDQLRKTYYQLLDQYDLSETLKMHITLN